MSARTASCILGPLGTHNFMLRQYSSSVTYASGSNIFSPSIAPFASESPSQLMPSPANVTAPSGDVTHTSSQNALETSVFFAQVGTTTVPVQSGSLSLASDSTSSSLPSLIIASTQDGALTTSTQPGQALSSNSQVFILHIPACT